MVIVPVRTVAAALAAIVYDTAPAPVPVAPELIVIQPTLLTAVHGHAAGEPTFTVPLVTPSGTEMLDGDRLVVHAAPSWVTVTVCPAMVIVPVREPPPGLPAIESDTLPVPLPDVPLVTTIHEAALAPVQEHPPPVVTDTVPLVAGADTCRLVVDRLKVHGVPACVTVNVWPAAVIVAVRMAAAVLAAAL